VAPNEFAERFRYDLISSTLLSSTVPVTPLPGHHRGRSSTPDAAIPGRLVAQQEDDDERAEGERRLFASTLAFLGLAALLSQYRLASFMAFVGSLVLLQTPEPPTHSKKQALSMQQTLDSLKDAGTCWDAAVNECMAIVERDEKA